MNPKNLLTDKNLNGSALLSAFAVGTVVAFLATIQVVQADRGGGTGVQSLGPLAGGAGVDLAEGESLAVDEAGNLVVVDEEGNVLRSATGAAGTATGDGGEAAASASGGGGGSSGGGANVGGGGGGSGSGSGGGGCNPGATDTGVTASQVKLGATVAESGIAEGFLGEVRQGMEAVRRRVNNQGGVFCRSLEIKYVDDGWSPDAGKRALENLVQEGVFAFAVSPSSEGVNAAAANGPNGTFQKNKLPLVGADGLNVTQFSDPFIFPVAAATITSVDVMIKDAWDRGMREPAIVFGNGYRFGLEGAFAANAAYKKLSGKDIPGYSNPLTSAANCSGRFCGIPTDGSYVNQVGVFNSACAQGTPCDYMILLLEPASALKWMARTAGSKAPADFAHGMGGPQPLFTFDFGKECGDKCNGLRLWTGYNPPIEAYAKQPAVARFVQELQAVSPSADRFNQFTMGGYVGMEVLVAALNATGPNLTRAGLVDALNKMPAVETGLTASPLAWDPPGSAAARHANSRVQAFEINSREGFTGWKLVNGPTGDPWLGQHTGR